MGRVLDVAAMLRQATPTTRREILKLAGAGGIAGPALVAMLARDGVKPVYAAPAARQDGEPRKGGTFVVSGHQEIDSLNPDNQGASVPWTVITQIHNALLEYDPNLELQPVLAESMPEMSEDGLTHTFKLRSGVKFHNGDEFTSADVKYWFEYQMNPDNATILHTDFAAIESVEAPDPTTVIVKLKQVDADFNVRVATKFIPSSRHHQEVGHDAYNGNPVGTGPFMLESWDPAGSTLLKAFPDHFRGAPNFDEFRLDVVPEPANRVIGLETGEADSSAWNLSAEDNVRLAADTENFTAIVTSSFGVNHFPLNNRLPQLSDKRVRQAMMWAIDRQKIIDDIWLGTATLATSNLSPASPWYNPDVPQYYYDPERAAALLDEAGWVLNGEWREKDGQRLSFTCVTITGDSVRGLEAQVVQQYLKDVGIDMQLDTQEVAAILEKLPKGEMDASVFNWTYGDITPDATITLGTGGENNFSGFSNARVDELLAAGLLELDPEKRRAIYNEIQAIVAEEVPFLFMMYWDWYNIFTKRVKGLPETAKGGFELYAQAYTYWFEE